MTVMEAATLVIPKGFDPLIDSWEAVAMRMPQAEAKLVHRFAPGIYVREMTCPAWTVVTTAIHKTEHPFVITKGKVVVWDGEKWTPIEAPYTGITKAGTRRVVLVFEETVWTTFHATDLTDPAEIEKEVVEDYPHGFLNYALPEGDE